MAETMALPESGFEPIDRHFGRFVGELGGGSPGSVVLAAAMVSRALRQGSICLDIAAVAGGPVDEESPASPACPSADAWIAALRASPAVGAPGHTRPLVLDGRLLYLYRYWDYEQRLAAVITQRAAQTVAMDRAALGRQVATMFDCSDRAPVDWQAVATVLAACRRLCVVSGGPGTGKTTTAAAVLAVLARLSQDRPLRMALAAPTGKAAERIAQVIATSPYVLACEPPVRQSIPAEAHTIQRLLGPRPASPRFRHDRDNPLPYDVIVVDEASMIDVALMCKLVEAVRPESRLILLGDRDQLASVEAGAVLSSICDGVVPGRVGAESAVMVREALGLGLESIQSQAALANSIVLLTRSRRFTEDRGIGALSAAINKGDAEAAVALLQRGGAADTAWRPLPAALSLADALKPVVNQWITPVVRATSPSEAFALASRFRMLCALRNGPYGSRAINEAVETLLRRTGAIVGNGDWYPGRPVLITGNHYGLGLFNGDLGITLPDPANPAALRVYFASSSNTFRSFLPQQLPDHETVYAMTVHKSQGSEFGEILLILPDRRSPVLGRELLYTGITRAKERVEIWGTPEVFAAAVAHRTRRLSGLAGRLWS